MESPPVQLCHSATEYTKGFDITIDTKEVDMDDDMYTVVTLYYRAKPTSTPIGATPKLAKPNSPLKLPVIAQGKWGDVKKKLQFRPYFQGFFHVSVSGTAVSTLDGYTKVKSTTTCHTKLVTVVP